MKRLSLVIFMLFLSIVFLYSTGTKEEEAAGMEGPLELTFLNTYHASQGPMTPEHEFWQLILEKQNVKLNMISVHDNDYVDRKNLMFSSGDYPDVYREWPGYLIEHVADGIAIGLSDEIAEYGKDIQKHFDESDKVKYAFSNSEGEIVGIPMITEPAWSNWYMIRKDWLDELSLEMPANHDELYQVLKAFKTADPAGNGNTIPFSTRFFFYLSGWTDFDHWSAICWDPHMDDFKIGPVTQEYKEALMYLNKLYKEDLLDQEFITNNSQTWQQKVSQGHVGLMNDNLARKNWANDVFKEQDPNTDWEFVFVPPFPDRNGKAFHRMNWDLGRAAGITVANEHPEETVEFFNWFFTEEGEMIRNFGVEGEHYEKQNGKIVPIKSREYMTNTYYERGGNFWPGIQTLDWNIVAYPDSIDPITYLRENGWINSIAPVVRRTPEESAEYKEYSSAVSKFIEESTVAFIMGTKSFDEWNSYVSKLNELGVQKMLDIYKTAFNRFR
jgi:putative aldouronate transport system substrate-binding protein